MTNENAVKKNKGGINRLPIDVYKFSSTDVVNYLESNVLGFKLLKSDFTRWTGVSENHSYVRMRVVISPKDILVKSSGNGYVDRFLASNAAGMKYDEDVIRALEPFMYPASIANIRKHPEVIQRLGQYGVCGKNLDDIIANSGITYNSNVNCFGVYLRPERIIAQILEDPAKNEIDGNMSIISVEGTTSETIRWTCLVVGNENIPLGNKDISVDAIFNNH